MHVQTRSANPDADAVLAEIVRRLVAAFQPERIYLFGSHARGDAGPDSDYDLLMVLGQLQEPSYRLAQRAHSLLWGLGTAADILVVPPGVRQPSPPESLSPSDRGQGGRAASWPLTRHG